MIAEKNRDRWNSGVVSGVLTYSTGGVSHLEIEKRYAAALEAEYRRGLRDGKKEIQS